MQVPTSNDLTESHSTNSNLTTCSWGAICPGNPTPVERIPKRRGEKQSVKMWGSKPINLAESGSEDDGLLGGGELGGVRVGGDLRRLRHGGEGEVGMRAE